ncbi:MAG: hypothetical protein WBB86_00245 [Candidatus Omnitrophota bacterium]
MKKLAAILVIVFIVGTIFTAAAEAGKITTKIINIIKTRGQTSTPTPTATTAVRG